MSEENSYEISGVWVVKKGVFRTPPNEDIKFILGNKFCYGIRNVTENIYDILADGKQYLWATEYKVVAIDKANNYINGSICFRMVRATSGNETIWATTERLHFGNIPQSCSSAFYEWLTYMADKLTDENSLTRIVSFVRLYTGDTITSSGGKCFKKLTTEPVGDNENGKPCFAAGTQIALASGTTKSVEDVTYDDELLVWDFDNGCYASARPLWICAGPVVKRYYHLIFDNGKVLDVIINHRGVGHRVFCLDTNRFEYSNQCVGKSIVTENGVTKLISCEVIERNETYHNIITDYHMNVYANSILTSTGLNNLYPIKDMQFVKTDRPLIPIFALNDCPEKYYHGLRIGEQVEYTIERLNEKLEVIKNSAVENRS